MPRGITVEEALRLAKARRFNANLVIDLEPSPGQAFAMLAESNGRRSSGGGT